MSEDRKIIVAAAQLGPIQLETPREKVLQRMLKLLDDASSQGVRLVTFPELALTTFFPRHVLTDEAELAKFFEPESEGEPKALRASPNLKPLFDKAQGLGIDFAVGYAERWTDAAGKKTDYNTMIYYSAIEDSIISKYRKVHLPGSYEPFNRPNFSEQLEKRYFTPGDLGFPAFRAPGLVNDAAKADSKDSTPGKGDPILGMLICNDRRWPEAWRCYGLQGVELVLEGYNTTGYAPQNRGDEEEQYDLAVFHHRLSCQAGSYQNACFSINTAKAGVEDGGLLIAGSVIVAPSGKIVAESKTRDDELVVAEIDLCDCARYKNGVFNFAKHRRVEHYSPIVNQVGAVEIPLLSSK
ncbi:putative amidohydrolase [Geosmithia morbida]|uniref:Amidohydrolase n=1 Tax=Geosmithia morbida TaxID=1094350 RepID=A0A9P4YSH4_9HYPO|nr:putative amidohydrolase [Geosmithia morbida]KAF4120836.1 putative amidohydrolase [Geosmithia morbida]